MISIKIKITSGEHPEVFFLFGAGHCFLPGTRNSHFSRPVTGTEFSTCHHFPELVNFIEINFPDKTEDSFFQAAPQFNRHLLFTSALYDSQVLVLRSHNRCHHAIELRKNSAAPNLSLSVFEKKRRHYSSQYSLSFCPVFPEALQPFYTGFRTIRFIHDWHFCRFPHHLLLLF